MTLEKIRAKKRRGSAMPGGVEQGMGPEGHWQPLRGSTQSLVDQLLGHLVGLIGNEGLRPGMRLPSVRAMAQETGLSRFTVVQAYDRLAAQGLVVSRRGAGFFVSAKRLPAAPLSCSTTVLAPQGAFDTAFLMRSMFSAQQPGGYTAGSGLLPPGWLDIGMLAAAIRSVGRTAGSSLLSYGMPHGYRPLRQQIASLLQAQDVPAHPDQHLMMVAGVTQGLDLIVRSLLQPGDCVLVEDPGWFLVCGQLVAQGMRVVGVPRSQDGPDLVALAQLAAQFRPRMFIVNTAVHNPTGTTLSAGVAHGVLRIAERFDFLLVEDDTFADFHPGYPVRLAALDRLQRVLLIGGYAKTLGGGLRVGYIAGHPERIRQLIDCKLLSGPTSPELGEQVVYRILAEGQYRHHVERLRERVNQARSRCLSRLEELGCGVPLRPHAGMFVWVDCRKDAEAVSRQAVAQGVVLPHGALFSPSGRFGNMLRIPVPMVEQPQAWGIFVQALQSGEGGS